MGPGLIQKVSLSWHFEFSSGAPGAPGNYYLRSQPLFPHGTHGAAEGLQGARRKLIGAKLWHRATWNGEEITPAASSMRLDLGGGQVDDESDEAIPLIGYDWPYAASQTLQPRTATAMFGSGYSPIQDPLAAARTQAALVWFGCADCVPVLCDQDVRLLARSAQIWEGPARVGGISITARATLWIASD